MDRYVDSEIRRYRDTAAGESVTAGSGKRVSFCFFSG